jgi:hypothetical protein
MALITIGPDVDSNPLNNNFTYVDDKIGALSSLNTINKTNIVNAVNEVNTSLGTHKADKAPHPNIPKCRVHHNANQSILDSQLTVLNFNSERFDNDTMHDNATNNSRITVKTAGKGVAYIALSFGSNSTGIRSVNIRLNGTTILAQDLRQAVNGAATSFAFSCPPYDFSVNDYLEVTVYHTGGVPIDIVSSAAFSPEFGLVMEG